MRGFRKFFIRGSNSNVFCFFLVDEGREDQNNTKGVPSSASQLFRWRADGGPTLNASLVFQGIQTSIAKKPYIFVIFQGGGCPDPLSTPLDLPMQCMNGPAHKILVLVTYAQMSLINVHVDVSSKACSLNFVLGHTTKG